MQSTQGSTTGTTPTNNTGKQDEKTTVMGKLFHGILQQVLKQANENASNN